MLFKDFKLVDRSQDRRTHKNGKLTSIIASLLDSTVIARCIDVRNPVYMYIAAALFVQNTSTSIIEIFSSRSEQCLNKAKRRQEQLDTLLLLFSS